MFSRRHYREVGGYYKRPNPLGDAVRLMQMRLFKEVAFNVASKFPNPITNIGEVVSYQNQLMEEANRFCFQCMGVK